MRWLFRNPTDAVEANQRKLIIEQIERWWRAFVEKSPEMDALFRNRANFDLPQWMSDNLQIIDRRLMWEFSGEAVGHRLVITPEGDRQLRPLVREILKRAPQISGWRFYEYRQPETAGQAIATVKGRTRQDLSQTTVRVRGGPLHSVDLTYFSPSCRGPEDRDALGAAFVATESLLGEEILDKWVGLINVSPPAPRERTIPFDRLLPTTNAVLEHVREQLPATPCFEWPDGTEWSSFKMPLYDAPRPTGEGVPEYPGRADLLGGITMYRQMFEFAQADRPFFSERFSRFGETFCYVKIDGIEGLTGSKFSDRGQIEDALNDALKPSKIGCVVGGGTGLRYSYSDLALIDLERGSEIVRSVLRDSRVPHRSWILFNDAELQTEWAGIYDDTPPPALEVD